MNTDTEAPLRRREVASAISEFSDLRRMNARLIEAIARTSMITPTDYRALVFIDLRGPLPLKAVANHLALTSGSGTALADRIERAGMAVRRPNPDDRRSLLLHLTVDGREVVERGREIYLAVFDKALPAESAGLITRTLADLASGMSSAVENLLASSYHDGRHRTGLV